MNWRCKEPRVKETVGQTNRGRNERRAKRTGGKMPEV